MDELRGKTGIVIHAGVSTGTRIIGKFLNVMSLGAVNSSSAELVISVDGEARREPFYEAFRGQRLGDQQFVDGAVEHGAEYIEIVELDGVGVARPQARHLAGADHQAALGQHPLEFAGLPNAAVGRGQAQIPLH